MKKLIFGITILSVLASCKPKKDENAKLPFDVWTEDVQNIVVNEEGMIRGMELGMPGTQINKELAKLEVKEDNYAYFQADLNAAEFFDIEYFMVEDTLKKVEIEIYPSNDSRTPQLLVELESYFENKFGASMQGFDDFKIWNAKNSRGKNVTIGVRYEIPVAANEVSKVKIKAELTEW